MSDINGFSEIDFNIDNSPLSQGDVFIWNNPSKPWGEMGIIITADCDIYRNKNSGILSYVPVIHMGEYLFSRMISKVENIRDKSIQEICSLILKSYKLKNQDVGDFTSDVVSFSIFSGEESKFIESLEITDKHILSKLESLVERAKESRNIIESGKLENLTSFLMKNSTAQNPKAAVSSEIKNHIEKMPGDYFFLNNIGINMSDGYIAYLRLIREIGDEELALKASDMRKNTTKARRLGRLKSPYVYALTQKLANVFSSIGLPQTYELSRAIRVNGILQ